MEEMKITKEELNNLKVFNKSDNSTIYIKDEDTLIKIYNQIDYKMIEKMKFFYDLNLKYICNPNELVSIDKDTCGYSMKNRKYYYPITIYKNFPIIERINLIEKLMILLKSLHHNEIIYGNLNPDNVLSNGINIYLTDIVSTKTKNHDFNKLSAMMHSYKEENGKMDYNLDNYMLNILTIYLLNENLEYEDVPKIIYETLVNKFNNIPTQEIIGLTDNSKCMEIGYKMINPQDGIEELFIEHMDKEIYKEETTDKRR